MTAFIKIRALRQVRASIDRIGSRAEGSEPCTDCKALLQQAKTLSNHPGTGMAPIDSLVERVQCLSEESRGAPLQQLFGRRPKQEHVLHALGAALKHNDSGLQTVKLQRLQVGHYHNYRVYSR